MNIRLDVTLSDITGFSAMKIMEAIISCQKNGKDLAKLPYYKVKKS